MFPKKNRFSWIVPPKRKPTVLNTHKQKNYIKICFALAVDTFEYNICTKYGKSFFGKGYGENLFLQKMVFPEKNVIFNYYFVV